MRRMAGSGDVVAITVTAFGCEAVRCPPGFEARTHGEALVELANPSRIRELAITSVNGGIAFGPVVKASSAVLVPATARAGKGNLSFSLGHCGLGSPIDVDGSLWDPVGQIDGDATDVVNSSNGTILFLGQQTARFETSGGFRADLVRRAGSKAYRLCS
jgi:hypothetical protein